MNAEIKKKNIVKHICRFNSSSNWFLFEIIKNRYVLQTIEYSFSIILFLKQRLNDSILTF